MVPANTGAGMSARGGALRLVQHEPREVRRAHALGLISVREDPDSLQLRHLGVRAAALEVGAEEHVGVDLLLVPDADGAPAAEDDAVARDERIPRPGAALACRCVGAPDQLERVPAQAALPGEIHVRRAVAVPGDAFVAAAGQDQRAPAEAQGAHSAAQFVRHFGEQRHRLQRRVVDAADEPALRLRHVPVVIARPGVALEHLELAQIDRVPAQRYVASRSPLFSANRPVRASRRSVTQGGERERDRNDATHGSAAVCCGSGEVNADLREHGNPQVALQNGEQHPDCYPEHQLPQTQRGHGVHLVPLGCAIPGADSRLPAGRTLATQVARNLLEARLDGVDYCTNAARPGEVRVHDEPEVLEIDRGVGKDPPQVALGVPDVTGQGADPDPQGDGAQERERVVRAQHEPGVRRFLAGDPRSAQRSHFQHHDVVSCKSASRCGPRVRGEIAARRVRRLGDPGDAARDEFAALRPEVAERDVGFAAGEVESSRPRREVHPDLGMDLVERPHGGKDHDLPQHLGGGEADDARELAIGAEGALLDQHRCLFHLLGGGADAFAGLGQDQPVRRALEELRPEIVLERGKPAADGCVVDPQLPRRRGQGPRAAQLQEVPEIAPVRHAMHCCMDEKQTCAGSRSACRASMQGRRREECSMAAALISSLQSGVPAVRNASHSRWTLVTTSFGLSMALLDTTAVNVAVPSIQAGLRTDVLGLSWVIDGYTLTLASLLLVAGGLGDRLGAKRLFPAGLGVFTAAAAACGFAPGLATLVLARILQGAGAAMFLPSSLAILREAYPRPKERAQAIGIWSALTAIAGACGPLFGGAMIASLGWRSIFLLNVPVGIVAVAMVLRFVRTSPAGAHRGFDLPAQMTGALALALLAWALIERSAFGWSSPRILLALAAAVAAALGFVYLEHRSASPLLPLQLFANRTFSSTASAALLYAGGFFGSVFVFSMYFQGLRGDSPLDAGLHTTAITVSFGLTSIAGGRFAGRYGTRGPILAGLSLLAAGAFVFAGLPEVAPFWIVSLPLVLIGVGAGLVAPSMNAAILASVPAALSGIGAGVLNASRQVGTALGVAVFASLFHGSAPMSAVRTSLLWAGVLYLAALALSLRARPHVPAAAALEVVDH